MLYQVSEGRQRDQPARQGRQTKPSSSKETAVLLDTPALCLEVPGRRRRVRGVRFVGLRLSGRKVAVQRDSSLHLPWLSCCGQHARNVAEMCGPGFLKQNKTQNTSSTHPGLSLPTLVSLSAPHPLSQRFLVQLSSSLECAFLFPVSIPASSSDITFSLKIGSESYFYPLSRDRPSQTPTGCRNEFKTNPEEEREKGLG